MIARTQIGRAKLLTSLRHAVFIFAAAFLVAGGGLGVEILLKNKEAKGIEHQNELLTQELRTTQAEIDRANRLTTSSIPDDLSAVGKLQSSIEQMAADRNCAVSEFRASSEVSPYLTRFAKTGGSSGWGQVEVQISLSGKAKNVTSTLVSLIDTQIPFEFDSLELTRDKVDEVGDATVIGHATLRVLIRTEKVSS